MKIDPNTKVAALLEAYPALEQTLMDLSPSFAKLRNPVLRRTVARVTTLQQAARIAGISPGVMVQTLRRAAGLTDNEPDSGAGDTDKTSGETTGGTSGGASGETSGGVSGETSAPAWFDASRITVRYDATPVIESGRSPMNEIIRLAEDLGCCDIMELTAPFQPVPIIDLLKTKGFAVWYSDGKSYFVRG